MTRTLVLAALPVLAAAPAYAGGSGMPWESGFQQLLESITGPTAKTIGVVVIIVAAFAYALAPDGTVLKKGFGIVMALFIAFTATTTVSTFFGFAGGAVLAP